MKCGGCYQNICVDLRHRSSICQNRSMIYGNIYHDVKSYELLEDFLSMIEWHMMTGAHDPRRCRAAR